MDFALERAHRAKRLLPLPFDKLLRANPTLSAVELLGTIRHSYPGRFDNVRFEDDAARANEMERKRDETIDR